MLRSRGGLDNHPESSKFAQLYRLMSIYSLIKPPKGSNVTGGEICEVLCNEPAIKPTSSNLLTKVQVMAKVTKILECEEFDPNIDVDLSENDFSEHCKAIKAAIIGHMSGYVARTALARFCDNCSFCKKALTSKDETLPQNILTHFRSYGFLTYPSVELFNLISALETVVLQTLHDGLKKDTLYTVMDNFVFNNTKLPRVGCEEHKYLVTEKVFYFYVTTRMYFASRVNRRENASIKRSKAHSKKSKLVTK